ncbi:MAG: sigma 54-interacting transcriptional regulator [Myxococcota bacterium]|nr:sigma 54-interacting transcriptional regulator [Myxococcota bacterium]MDW8360831.1 sigma 54-interacting transcriptional regulator [Myxococcales bacterium]
MKLEADSPTKIVYIPGQPPTLTLRRCKLEVIRDGRTEEHVFDREVVTVGAAADNDLVIADDDTVSRQHCRIFLEGDHFMIRDLDSTNGTFVDRVRVREAWLRPEQEVLIGKTTLRFSAVDQRVRIVPSERDRYGEIIGRDRKMREIYAILEKIAPTDATVVIEGETGTGKEVVARTIHQQSRRRDGPFMVFDCGAVPENLIESELFGHEKGSFTGAVATRQGVFEMADGGTVFLDELGELALELQPKLLRVLEQREVKRVGGARPIKVDVRVVAATNRDLEAEVRAGRFREDLFYRLSVVRVLLPPLRERKEDIELLVRHFLRTGQFNRTRDGGRRVQRVSREALDRLLAYDWPGNVRELHNVIERAVSFCEGESIEVHDLPDHVARARGRVSEAVAGASAETPALSEGSGRSPVVSGPFKDAKEAWIASFEREYIEHLLRKNNFNISHAAREADIDRKYFRKLMRKYGLGGAAASEEGEED